jgi:hypothetical protein
MGVLKKVWNWFFCSQKTKAFDSLKEERLTVVYKKREDEIQHTFTQVENKPKENIFLTKKIKKEGFRRAVGDESLDKIKKYLIKNGSIDTVTCQKQFNIKSLRNFIWILRKDGLDIKTQKIEVYNDSAEKIKAVNYILLSKNTIIS